MCICVVYPIVESASALRDVSKGLFSDLGVLVGKKKPNSASVEASGA
jgi:hypothetical protein